MGCKFRKIFLNNGFQKAYRRKFAEMMPQVHNHETFRAIEIVMGHISGQKHLRSLCNCVWDRALPASAAYGYTGYAALEWF